MARRDVLKAAAGVMSASLLGPVLAGSARAQTRPPAPGVNQIRSGHNILFVFTDQERYHARWPKGLSLPGHERLQRNGITFTNHQCPATMCTSSRSVLLTGLQTTDNGMYENLDVPWMKSLSTDKPTIGHMLRKAGYYTAYKGKWHLTKEFETVNKLGSPTKIFTEEMEAYGFSDYFGIGDIIAHTQGGYLHDGVISAMAGSWLRGKGRELAGEGKPWFLAVNLVNPHDVMFYDTDAPGMPVQSTRGLTHVARDPVDPLYAKQWSFGLPKSHDQALDAPGRPPAHADFLKSHDALVGNIPNEAPRWNRRHNYYLNCMRDVDRNIASVLDELEAAGLTDRTIVVVTADHGDMDGAHQLHAKGAVAYREQNNVPLVIAHPAHAGGRQCRALSSHLDLAPTLVAMTGADAAKRGEITKGLPGRDLSDLLASPESAGVNALHEGVLFNYNMFAYLDGDFLMRAVDFMQKGGNPKALKEAGITPDMLKRGAVRSIFDGRYVFSRYFSPKQHNRPESIESLYKLNDVELYDREADPLEMKNLAAKQGESAELVVAMNAKLNRLIDAEVGEDRGQMLPGGADGGWEVTAETMAP